jgi:hypothetical protein
MSIEILIELLISIFLIAAGLMAKYSHNDGWSSAKKYWIYLVVIGAMSLVLEIYKYWLR